MLLGVLLIGWAAYRGIAHWQSIPSTWDAVWHANTVRFILDTGQASSTHMGELRNVETHAPLYYPSVFHALTAVFCQLTGAAPTTGYTLSSVAASVWLFPSSAAMLTWFCIRPRTSEWRAAGAAATAAALSASFTSVPYVEFGVAAMPNLAAYGVAVPTLVLITSTLRHRDRIPVAVLALVGVFSVHLTGGFVVILFLVAWWLLDALWHPVRGRLADVLTLAAVARADRADPGAAVPRGTEAGRHHRRARVPQLQEREAGRHRRAVPAHPPPQRLPDPVRAGRCWRHRHGDLPATRKSGGRRPSGWC